MNDWATLDSPVLSLLLSYLPQRESLRLSRLARSWPKLAGNCFRGLSIVGSTPLALIRVIAVADGFQHLRTLVIDNVDVVSSCVENGNFVKLTTEFFEELIRSKPPIEYLSLRSLIVADSDITSAFKLLEKSLQLAQVGLRLRTLEIKDAGPSICAEELLCILGDVELFPCLVNLKLEGCRETQKDRELALIPGPFAAQLQRLHLSRNFLGPSGAAALARCFPNMIQLRALLIAVNCLGHQGATHVAEHLASLHGTLEELDLSSNGLGPEGLLVLLEPLKHLVHLRVLRLRSCWVSSEGVEILANVLRGVGARLEELDLSQNKLDGNSMRLLLADLPAMPELRCLSLSENYFATFSFAAGTRFPLVPGTGANSFMRLGEAAPALQELQLDSIGLGICEFALRAIGAALPRSLVKLSLSASMMRASQLSLLRTVIPVLPRLTHLTMVQAQLDDAAALLLAGFGGGGRETPLPALRFLDIRGNVVRKDALDALKAELCKGNAFMRLIANSKKSLLLV